MMIVRALSACACLVLLGCEPSYDFIQTQCAKARHGINRIEECETRQSCTYDYLELEHYNARVAKYCAVEPE